MFKLFKDFKKLQADVQKLNNKISFYKTCVNCNQIFMPPSQGLTGLSKIDYENCTICAPSLKSDKNLHSWVDSNKDKVRELQLKESRAQ
ncbi:MAG TPA: hypothetical protein ENJ28_04995 [Gammaproteobacteria bacterium]|nr:hypothetical protein [Gammaproteobacteria bacterium]